MPRSAASLCRLVLLAAAVALTLPPVRLSAHGGGTPQLVAAEAGPYRLYVWTQPEPWRAGEAHVTVAVVAPPAGETGAETPVLDAQVVLRFEPADEPAAAFEAAAAPSELLAAGGYYEADTRLPSAGDWRVSIAVAGPLGSGEAAFTAAVAPGRTFRLSWLIIGALASMAAASLLAARLRRRKTHRPKGRRTLIDGAASSWPGAANGEGP